MHKWLSVILKQLIDAPQSHTKVTAIGFTGHNWQAPSVEVPRSQWGSAAAGQLGPQAPNQEIPRSQWWPAAAGQMGPPNQVSLPATPALGAIGGSGPLLPPNGEYYSLRQRL